MGERFSAWHVRQNRKCKDGLQNYCFFRHSSKASRDIIIRNSDKEEYIAKVTKTFGNENV